MDEPIEIERKYLIERPDEAALLAREGCTCSKITQTYLLPSEAHTTERVRMRVDDTGCVYTHTIKKRINALKCIEREEEISKEAYEALLLRSDPTRGTVHKSRYFLRENGRIYEIDIYPFWQKKAIMEVEMQSEDETFALPSGIRVIKDVTGEPRYKNAQIARRKMRIPTKKQRPRRDK